MSALGEIMTLFGKDKMIEAAAGYQKTLVTSQHSLTGIPLDMLCSRLAARPGGQEDVQNLVTPESVALLGDLLKLSAHERITAENALKHPAFKILKPGH